jgi:Zn-finger nucleic acid-binding protein
MQAGNLACPTCGAPAAADAHRCTYCGSPLATVACPSCFAMVFRGSDYCRHCGAAIQAFEENTEGKPCPRCDQPMQQKQVGDTRISECTSCGGMWIDSAAFERICADRQRQAAVITSELPPPMPSSNAEAQRFYIHCPICGGMLNRTGFAGHSGIVIDICKRHGIWFDRDELRRIVEFIRAGGIDQARQHELEKLQHERAQLERMRSEPNTTLSSRDFGPFASEQDQTTIDLVQLVGGLLRFLRR